MTSANQFFRILLIPAGYWSRAIKAKCCDELHPQTQQDGETVKEVTPFEPRYHAFPNTPEAAEFVSHCAREGIEFSGQRLYVSFATVALRSTTLAIRLETSDEEKHLPDKLEWLTKLFDLWQRAEAGQSPLPLDDWTLSEVENHARNAHFFGTARLQMRWSDAFALDQIRRWEQYEKDTGVGKKMNFVSDVEGAAAMQYGLHVSTPSLMASALKAYAVAG